MKRHTAPAALLALAAPLVCAQSSVVLYGRLDGGVQFVSHQSLSNGQSHAAWSAEGGDWGTSMLGFRGTEDLGDGRSAVFDLETAPQITNGSSGGGRMFSRRAYVGLHDDTLGQLQAGRNLFIDSDGVWAFDPFVQEAVSSASLVRGRNWQQTNNNVEYHSPTFHGFDVQAQYAFGNQPGNFNAGATGEFGRSDGVMVTYRSSYFDVRGIYDELRDSSGRFTNVFESSREYFVGGNLRLSPFTIQTAWTHYAAPDTQPGIADSADHFWLGATWQITPAWAMTGAGFYIRVRDGAGDATHDGGGHAMLYALGSTYNFTKRTFVYGTVAYLRNGAHSDFSVFASAPGTQPGTGTNPLAGQSQTTAYLGIMHNF